MNLKHIQGWDGCSKHNLSCNRTKQGMEKLWKHFVTINLQRLYIHVGTWPTQGLFKSSPPHALHTQLTHHPRSKFDAYFVHFLCSLRQGRSGYVTFFYREHHTVPSTNSNWKSQTDTTFYSRITKYTQLDKPHVSTCSQHRAPMASIWTPSVCPFPLTKKKKGVLPMQGCVHAQKMSFYLLYMWTC